MSSLELFEAAEPNSSTSLFFPGSPEFYSSCIDRLRVPRLVFNKKIPLQRTPLLARNCLQLLSAVACLDIPTHYILPLRKNVTWALHCQRRIWRALFGSFQMTSLSQEELSSALVDSITAHRKCYFHSVNLTQGSDLRNFAMHAWLQCGIDVLSSEALLSFTELQQALERLLNESMHLSQNAPDILRVIRDDYYIKLQELEGSEFFRTLQNSLQVRYC